MSSNKNITTISGIVNKKLTSKSDEYKISSAEEGNKSNKKNKPFTCKQKLALMMLAIVDFMSFCSMSIMAPFFPKEATKKGVSESMAGFIFGFYALIMFLTSPVFGKILPRIGVKFLFVAGVLTSGICSVIFGTLHQIDNYYIFTASSFLIRGLAALGASAYTTAGYVIIINIFPDNAGAVRGLLETFVGLGMSVGPAIGGFLFAIGGFGLPFYVTGLITIFIVPFNICLLPSAEKCSIESKTGSLTKLLKLPTVLVTCFVITVIAMTWSFLDPTLEPHLRKFKLSPENIGLFFLLLSATYGIFSPIWGCLTDKIRNYWWLMAIGLFCNTASLSILGPSSLLSFLDDSLWLNIVSLSFLGISVAMALMPTYQAILDSALEGGFPEDLGTHSLIAGLWSCVYSLGEVLGPVLGGTLLENFGFSITSTVFSMINCLIAIMTALYFSTRKQRDMNCRSNGNDISSKETYNNKNCELQFA